MAGDRAGDPRGAADVLRRRRRRRGSAAARVMLACDLLPGSTGSGGGTGAVWRGGQGGGLEGEKTLEGRGANQCDCAVSEREMRDTYDLHKP